MTDHSADVLGFVRVRDALAEFCRTPMGAELARAMSPDVEPDRITREFDLVGELLDLGGEPDLGPVADARPELARVEQGLGLTGIQLLAVCGVARAARKLRDFAEKHRGRLPGIWSVAEELIAMPELESDVARSLDDSGDVLDTASAELKSIRRDVRRLRTRLVSRMERMTAAHPEWFGDRPTVRHDRFVLPVRIESREQLPGVVHESSGSGRTVFVEPLETVGEQNALAELRGAEAEEVARILRRLSEEVGRRAGEFRSNINLLARLDLLQAKKRFAEKYGCTRPEVAVDGRYVLRRARHPLLAARGGPVVPLDFEFPEGQSVVLISGPNAGGKTVALKTLGLFSLMLGCGMFLPAQEGTTLPVSRSILADIGDEQSIDADLSSFTAHASRLRDFLERADAATLVLLDEIGASTAPEEGAALAMAVLESLREKGARVVATTHLGMLKLLVQQEDGMANAAMGFADGRPTYRLALGVPGESSAFEMAASVGIQPEVLGRARARLGAEWLDLNEKLRQIGLELEQARKARESAEQDQLQSRRLRVVYEAKLEELAGRADTEVERANAEREIVLTQARRDIENLVRQIRESGAAHEAIVSAKRYVETELARLATPPDHHVDTGDSPSLAVGDIVESRLFRRVGRVAEINDRRAMVVFGNVRVEVDSADLRRVGPGEAPVVPTASATQEPYAFDPRLDIRGMRAEEAGERCRGFIDEGAAAGARELAILHGKGTGVLQSVVREQLRHDRRVERISFADVRQGGSGVTLVTLRGLDDQS